MRPMSYKLLGPRDTGCKTKEHAAVSRIGRDIISSEDGGITTCIRWRWEAIRCIVMIPLRSGPLLECSLAAVPHRDC